LLKYNNMGSSFEALIETNSAVKTDH
jgi:hypothetical protein